MTAESSETPCSKQGVTTAIACILCYNNPMLTCTAGTKSTVYRSSHLDLPACAALKCNCLCCSDTSHRSPTIRDLP